MPFFSVGLLEKRTPEIIFLTSSEATQVLLQAGFASFKLPSKTVVRQAGMDMLENNMFYKLLHKSGTFLINSMARKLENDMLHNVFCVFRVPEAGICPDLRKI